MDVLDKIKIMIALEPMTPDWGDWHERISAEFERITADLPDDEYTRVYEGTKTFLQTAGEDDHRWSAVWNYAASLYW